MTRPVFLTVDGQFAWDIFVILGQESIDRSTVTPRSIGFVDLGVGTIILDFAINEDGNLEICPTQSCAHCSRGLKISSHDLEEGSDRDVHGCQASTA